MDKLTTIGNSLVQHGKHNDRAYILSFHDEDGTATLDVVEFLAGMHNYSKIVAKVPEKHLSLFKKRNYATEGSFECDNFTRYFFVAKYLQEERKKVTNTELIEDVISQAKESRPKDIKGDFAIRLLAPEDIDTQIEIYKAVFASYPFPIYARHFIEETMKDNVRYYGVFEDDVMIATASADIDAKSGAAEMTDFATLPEHRGKGFAVSLLKKMENDLKKSGIKSFYTIARSVSYGMNKTFARCGYTFSGTLYNNTNINGEIESMNVWYKIA